MKNRLNLINFSEEGNGDLSRKASISFSNSIFDGVELIPDNNGDDKAVEKGIEDRLPIKTCYTASESEVGEDSENEDFEIVAREHGVSEDEGWEASTTMRNLNLHMLYCNYILSYEPWLIKLINLSQKSLSMKTDRRRI